EPLDLLVAEGRPEESALHRVIGGRGLAQAALHAMARKQGGPDRAARITGGGLNPQTAERPLAQDAAIANAVQRHPTGQAEVLAAGVTVERASQAEHHFLGHFLDRPRRVQLELGEVRLWT